MDTRPVTGQIFRPDSSPWMEADVWFTLFEGSYTSTRHYPKDSLRVKTDAQGNFVADLWPNEAGLTSTYWLCRLPSGEVFKFSLPVGTTSISIEALRSIGVPPAPPDPGLGAQLSALLDAHNNDPAAHPNLAEEREDLNNFPPWNLAQVPTQPHLSRLYLNGTKLIYVSDYSINGSTVNYLSPIILEPTDILEIYYQ